MTTTISKPVTRKTHHAVSGKALVVTLTPGGISLRLERSSRAVRIDYLALYLQLLDDERRGGQSDISIAPRKGRRS
jgi:hypothetical protein